jgi:hypothetical protein
MCRDPSWATLVVGLIPGSMGSSVFVGLGSNGGNMNTILIVVQMSIIAIWAMVAVLHTRRLMRLTRVVAYAAPREQVLRHRLRRAWWWLGREEFWSVVSRDSLRCLQLTLLLVVLGCSAW